MLFILVVYIFNCNLVFGTGNQSLYLGRIAVLNTLVFRNVNCNLVFGNATKLVFRPVCSALYISVYKFNCNFASRTVKQACNVGRICSDSYTSFYKFNCNPCI